MKIEYLSIKIDLSTQIYWNEWMDGLRALAYAYSHTILEYSWNYGNQQCLMILSDFSHFRLHANAMQCNACF